MRQFVLLGGIYLQVTVSTHEKIFLAAFTQQGHANVMIYMKCSLVIIVRPGHASLRSLLPSFGGELMYD